MAKLHNVIERVETQNINKNVPVMGNGSWQEINKNRCSRNYIQNFENHIISLGCSCEGTCSDDDFCVCLAQHQSYYDIHSRLEFAENHDPIYECNHCCNCDISCSNRVVQRGSPWSFEVINTNNKGKGLISKNDISKGSFVIEYIGVILTEEEAKYRFQEVQKNDSPCYIFALKEHYGSNNVKTYFIDATEKGNIARLINHSCDGNLKLVPVRTNYVEPHFSLFARRNISMNEELTFSYGTTNVNNQKDCKPCFCGSSSCTGFLPYDALVFESI